MGLFTNKIKRDDLKHGDHIYTYRAIFTYSHHGIYVGSCKVVHFTREHSSSSSSSSSWSWSSWSPSSCSSSWISPDSEVKDSSSSSEDSCALPYCGYKQPNNGVTISCLDCFLNNGSLYRFEYKVNSSIFLTRIRGGTCTTATSDNSQTVIHRAMHLLQNHDGFGNYDLLENNCEDFALYCKTGLIAHHNEKGVGTSGQAYSAVSVPVAALFTSPFALLISNPVGVATVTAGMYSMTRYASDIGVRKNVVKVPVEDLAMKLGPLSTLKRE